MAKTAKLSPIAPDTPLDEAEELRRVEDPRNYRMGTTSEVELMGLIIPERKFILKGLIAEKSINIVNGFRGSGKSWLMLMMGNEVSWEGEVGPWKVEAPTNVLLVDGEMPISLLQERMKMINRGRDIREKKYRMWVYSEAYAYRIGLKRASILDSVWREWLLEETEKRKIGLLILDNLSSLAPGIDENDKMAFDPVNRWLLELRFQGVSVIMAHHTGKSGQQRGTTAHEDHVDLAIDLTKPPGHQPHLCHFVCAVTKDRACATEGNKIVLELIEGKEGRVKFEWRDVKVVSDVYVKFIEENPNSTWHDAKDKLGISKATFYRAKDAVRRQSLT